MRTQFIGWLPVSWHLLLIAIGFMGCSEASWAVSSMRMNVSEIELLQNLINGSEKCLKDTYSLEDPGWEIASSSAPKSQQRYSQSNYLISPGNGMDLDAPLTIGYLSSYLSSKTALGAIPLAIETINADPNLLPGRTLQFVAADIGNPVGNDALAMLAIRRMTEMRDNNQTIAFIGPDGQCAAEALVAAAWNLPMITHTCAETKLSEMPQTYFTFARTLPPSSKISKSVLALLKKFSWNKLIIIVSHRTEWIQIKDAVKELARLKDINVTDVIQIKDDYIPSQIEQLYRIAQDTYQRTRVYLFIGEHAALVDFVKSLQELKVLENGEYVVIAIDDFNFKPEENAPQYTSRNYIDPYLPIMKNSDHILQAFRSVLRVTPSHPRNPELKNVMAKIKDYAKEPPFCVPYHPVIFKDIEVPIHAYHAYDALMTYARALTEALKDGHDPRNGTAIMERIRNRPYHSILGFEVFIDSNGDAEGNYTVVSMLPFKGATNESDNLRHEVEYVMQPVGYFQYSATASKTSDLPEFRFFNASRPIDWVGKKPPASEPPCGFMGKNCGEQRSQPDWRTFVICTVSAVVLIVAIGLVSRHYRYEHKLACLLWRVDIREVEFICQDHNEQSSPHISHVVKRQSLLMTLGGPSGGGNNNNSDSYICQTQPKSNSNFDFGMDLGLKRAYTRIGFFKGNIVAIRAITRKNVDLTRNIRKELKQMTELRHENIVPFIGASVDHGGAFVLTAYCARGSLEDILQNPDFKLDTMFIASLVADLIKGMIFLHDSEIISHGNLKSSNCLVDSRWVLQITDFGLHELKSNQDSRLKSQCANRLLWRAPELLRNPNPPLRGTQKGDVFSFGIILYEIVGRKGPWGDLLGEMSAKEILERVEHPEWFYYNSFRPPLPELSCKDYVIRCMQDCWQESPELRPDFKTIRGRLKEMEAGLKPNIFDNMLSMMEKYTYNLEGLVQERTDQLEEEKKKTEALLYRVLPKSVVESLKRGQPVEAETFDSVTIHFSDIVGFTTLSANSTPLQVVDLLNELYTLFDSILESYDAYKVETIGDAYMVASGLPIRNGDQHAAEIASLALHFLSEIRTFHIRHRPGETLKLRIGIHSGPCVAGVVGLRMPHYCLFGDTVNTASRMESSGEALRIHISAATKALLDRLGGYHTQERGVTPIKDKGQMMTHWLVSQEPWRTKRRFGDAALAELSSMMTDPVLIGASPTLLEIPDICDVADTGSLVRPSKDQDSETSTSSTWLLSECHLPPQPGISAVTILNEDTLSAGKERDCKFPVTAPVPTECKACIVRDIRHNGNVNVNGLLSPRHRSSPIITTYTETTPCL